MINRAGPMNRFAGLRDDPFFFDLAGFQAFVANPQAPAAGLRAAGGGSPVDAFAGTNILAIVVELPVTAITGGANANTGTIKTWVTSHRRQPDRPHGDPGDQHGPDPYGPEGRLQRGRPDQRRGQLPPRCDQHDQRRCEARLTSCSAPKLQDGGPLGNLTSEQVGAALIPDVVTIDFSKPVPVPQRPPPPG